MSLPQISSGGSGAYIDKGVKPRGKNAVNTCLYTRGIKLLSTKFFRWSKKKYCIYNYALIKEIVDHWNEDKRMNNRVKLHICIKLFVSPKLAFFHIRKVTISTGFYRYLLTLILIISIEISLLHTVITTQTNYRVHVCINRRPLTSKVGVHACLPPPPPATEFLLITLIYFILLK